MEGHVRARREGADMIDNPVSLIAHHQISPPDAQPVKQIQMSRQQAAPTKLHQALGMPLGIMLCQAASAAGSQDDCMHGPDPAE